MSSPALIEPGIFGIFRPVLLLPEGIADRLTPAQLQSILAHELCHVKRRDNLAAAMHMMVEAAFWFHPLVWWIGARLVEERERACDEEVLRSGSEPGVYAESILQVCKFYLESPLKCVAGVTGSDLKKRIESIMSGLPGRSLTPARKLMLVAASIGAIAGPVIFGVLAAPHIHAQSQTGVKTPLEFEVAEVRVNKSADPEAFGDVVPTWLNPGGRVTIRGATMKWLISEAYHVGKEGLGGAPNWLDAECYDVIAKAGPTASRNDVRLMLQKLLADRFGLRVHQDQKVIPVYALVVGKRAPKLLESKNDSTAKDGCQSASGAPGQIHLACHNLTMTDLAGSLPEMAPVYIDLPVVDLTDLKGAYDFKLDWSPRRGTGGPGRGADAPTAIDSAPGLTMFDAIESLGLKLERSKHAVNIVVIDHVENVPNDAAFDGALAKPAAAQASAQPARVLDGPRPSFEVASIRPSKADAGDRELSNEPGRRLSATNATLKMLIMLAYQVTANELTGGPDWMASDGFDIEAKPENPNATPEQFRQMVQRMLEDRFQLKTHFDTKEIPIYSLEVGKRGPKLKESKGNELDVIMRNSYGLMTGVKATMPMFAAALSKRLKRQVVDETGLKGAYNFKLEFTPEPDPAGTDEHHAPPPGDHPSIFTALQEQLGLNLKAGKGPVRVLVIDHAERPTDNSTAPAAKQEGALHLPAAALDGSVRSHTVALQNSTRALTGAPQTGAPQREKPLAFEVATIKLCGSGDTGGGARGGRGGGDGNGPSPDRMNLACQPVMNLIRMAYFNFAGGHINPRNTTPVDGGPAWVNSDRYQITAKAEGTPGQEMMRGPMLQALLEDRFKLKIRRESREVPAYAMTVARGGPKLKAFQEGSCVPVTTGVGGGPLPPPGPDGKLPVMCSMRSIKTPLNGSPSAWQVLGESLDGFARALGDDMDRIVINKTGLAGKFDFHLEFTPDESTPLLLNALRQRAAQNGDPVAASDPAGGLSIFTAIQQQLGLKLDGSKGAREFLVIDRIERPTEN